MLVILSVIIIINDDNNDRIGLKKFYIKFIIFKLQNIFEQKE